MVDELLAGRFTLEERSLLQLRPPTTNSDLRPPTPTTNSNLRPPTSDLQPQYSLNEVFVHRTEEASLLRTQVFVDDQYVATYAGDGVIVATPTGSTAYSLSCGGPILTPDSRCLLITPISAHTLTLRPVIVPDTAEIRLRVNSDCFLGRDSSRATLGAASEIDVRRAPFTIRLVRLGHQNFYSAIREKLMWGTEVRG
jgi:NAD+ kinase